LSATKLQTTEEEARNIRREILEAHVVSKGSQNQLRSRVTGLLGGNSLLSRETIALGVAKTDALLEFDAADVKHIFFETIKDLFYAIRTLEPEDLVEEDIQNFMGIADSLSNLIHSIQHRASQPNAQSDPIISEPETLAQPSIAQVNYDSTTGNLVYRFR
jgi:hypothetical protein